MLPEIAPTLIPTTFRTAPLSLCRYAGNADRRDRHGRRHMDRAGARAADRRRDRIADDRCGHDGLSELGARPIWRALCRCARAALRSEERRVGKEWRYRGEPE